MRSTAILLFALALVSGCDGRSSSGPLVRGFGSSASPDGSKRLEVTRREKSLVDFEVFDAASGKRLASDYIGSDVMRWFLYWETSARLWGYGSDRGYFKLFVFKSDGTVAETEVDESMPVPLVVWENLPSSLRQNFKTQQGDSEKSP